ncbi:MAG: hypothetical protein FIB08_04685 [Candidatus Methanoperedens sp.]|nr:hypothetical protein [Candidatus Methanoperedens sp.]
MAESKKLECPLCKGTQFKKEEGKIDSKWGFSAHRVDLVICEQCGFVMTFFKGRTIWDFD